MTLDRVTLENPFNSALTVYVPDGRFWTRNDPFSSDMTDRDAPVEFEVIVIETPGRTAPDSSVTLPLKSAVTADV